MGGRFLGLVSHFNNTKVSPEGVAKSAYMLKHATPPRLFANILQVAPKIFVGFFLCFWQKAERASVIRSEKKFCETPAVQRSCYLFFLVNFWRTCWLDFCHNYFCHKLYDFFSRRGCLVVWILLFFLFAQRLLETRLFLFSPKRGKTIRRWHWEPQLLAHRVAFLQSLGLHHLLSRQDGLRGRWS